MKHPARTTVGSVSVAEAARVTTLTLRVRHAKRTALRLKLFAILMHLACWIAPTTTKVELLTGDDA